MFHTSSESQLTSTDSLKRACPIPVLSIQSQISSESLYCKVEHCVLCCVMFQIRELKNLPLENSSKVKLTNLKCYKRWQRPHKENMENYKGPPQCVKSI